MTGRNAALERARYAGTVQKKGGGHPLPPCGGPHQGAGERPEDRSAVGGFRERIRPKG